MFQSQILVALLLFSDLGRQGVQFAPASRAFTLQGASAVVCCSAARRLSSCRMASIDAMKAVKAPSMACRICSAAAQDWTSTGPPAKASRDVLAAPS